MAVAYELVNRTSSYTGASSKVDLPQTRDEAGILYVEDQTGASTRDISIEGRSDSSAPWHRIAQLTNTDFISNINGTAWLTMKTMPQMRINVDNFNGASGKLLAYLIG